MDCNNNKITEYLEQNGSQFRNGYWTAPFPPFEKKHGVFSVFEARNGNFLCHYTPTGETFGLNELISRVGVPPDDDYVMKHDNFNTTSTEVLNVFSLDFPNYLDYLESRKLDVRICCYFLKQVQYRNHKGKFMGIGFENNKGGYEITVPLERPFKTCTSKSFTHFSGSDSKKAYVFEGVYDLLAYSTDKQLDVSVSNFQFPCDVIVLNSVSTVRGVDWWHYDYIHYFGDNDTEGDKALEIIKEDNSDAVIDQRYLYKDFKDYNDYLIYKKGIE